MSHDIRGEIKALDQEIRDLEGRIERGRKLAERCRRGEAEILRLESVFVSVAQDVPVEWFKPPYAPRVQGENRLSTIKYWCE